MVSFVPYYYSALYYLYPDARAKPIDMVRGLEGSRKISFPGVNDVTHTSNSFESNLNKNTREH